jgi:hypothetical protein
MSVKPQLVSFDPGFHGGDMAKTSERLLRGGSWTKQRTIILIPAGDMMPTKVALALASLYFPPNQSCHRMIAMGMEVGDAYSSAIAEIIAHPDLSQWEYLLTMEHDNLPPPDGLVRLIERMHQHPEFACIGGLYFCKGYGGCAHIWGDVSDPVLNYRPQVPRAGELVECYGTSMGFNLWRLSMFRDERLARPWFKTRNGTEGQGIGTQDLAFWTDARKYGYRCAVDCSIAVGHIDYNGTFGPKDFVW